MQQAQRGGAGLFGHGVGDKCNGETEDTPDTQTGEKAVDAEIDKPSRKRAEAGEDGVEQDGNREKARAAIAVTEGAKRQAADGPADQEDRGRVRAVLSGLLRDELFHRRVAGEVEELLVKAVEKPGKGGDAKNEPMVAIEQTPPGGRRGGLDHNDDGREKDCVSAIPRKRESLGNPRRANAKGVTVSGVELCRCQESRRAACWAFRQSSAALKAWAWVMAFSVRLRQSRMNSPKKRKPTLPATSMCCSP